MRLILATAAVLVCAAATATAAEAGSLSLVADGTRPGAIDLYVGADPGARVVIAERVGSHLEPIRTVDVGPPGFDILYKGAVWRCNRTTRYFEATTPFAAVPERTPFSVRTPSCGRRFSARVPKRARVRSKVAIKVSDRFRLGNMRPRVCVTPPGGRPRCRALRVPAGARSATRRFRPTKRGRWRVELRTAYQRTVKTMAVGVRPARAPRRRLPRILLTGDSMMQSLDNLLVDALEGRADVTKQVKVGTGLSKPGFDFVENTRRRSRRLKPAATVIFLGANDAYNLKDPSGRTVTCCEEPWIEAYTRRARRMIRAAGGRVLWLTLPAPRQEEGRVRFAAVDTAVVRAVLAEPRARVVDLVPVFTPGFRYSPFATYRGRRVRVREPDGVHLSVTGARITRTLVMRALEQSGVLHRR